MMGVKCQYSYIIQYTVTANPCGAYSLIHTGWTVTLFKRSTVCLVWIEWTMVTVKVTITAEAAGRSVTVTGCCHFILTCSRKVN